MILNTRGYIEHINERSTPKMILVFGFPATKGIKKSTSKNLIAVVVAGNCPHAGYN